MKLAYLILAHSNPDHLYRLAAQLCEPNTDIFIHIDEKTNIQPFFKMRELPGVSFITAREKVFWGAYSIVQATINGLNTIINTGNNYSFISLLSGQDYVLQSNAHIRRYLSANTGKAFMEFYPVHDVWLEAIPRVTKYHLTNFQVKGRHLVERLLNAVLPIRSMPYGMEPVGRSQWFSITGEQAAYILSFLRTYPKYQRFFKLTWGADELFFQTILFNSIYKNNMVNNNLRYIDWSAGGVSPKTLTMEDEQALTTTDCLFARKFAGNAEPILDVIDAHIAAQQVP